MIYMVEMALAIADRLAVADRLAGLRVVKPTAPASDRLSDFVHS
jgi:hypothetical protein